MENKYKELFEKIAPKKSDEELLRAVLDRKAVNMSEKKRFNKKAIIIPAAAAAVLLCTTVGVSAAYEWDIPAALSSVFNKSPETNNGEKTFEFNDFDLNEFGGKVLDQRFERDGYAVQMRGVVADMHSTLIFYDVILDEGHVFTLPLDNGEMFSYTYTEGDEVYVTMWEDSYLDLSNEYLDQNRNPDGTYNFDNFFKIGSEYEDIMLEKEGNVVHCVHRDDLKILSFKDKEIVYKIMGLHAGTRDRAYHEVEYEDILTIKFDFIKENDDITVDGNASFSLSSGEYGAVTSVHMTSLSLDVSVEWENGPEMYSEKAYHELKVRFKDGTVTENDILSWKRSGQVNADESGMLSQELLLNWKYPVKVADIDAIIIGNGEIKIN